MAAKVIPLIDRHGIGPIEDGVPMPEARAGRPAIYPFGRMKIGQSFTVPPEKYSSVRASANRYAHSHPPRKFITHVENDRIRVWRVK